VVGSNRRFSINISLYLETVQDRDIVTIIIIIINVYYANTAANIHTQLHVQERNKNIKKKNK